MLARLGVEIQQIAYSDAGGRVSLSFNHACAAIQFKIGQSKTLAYKSVTYYTLEDATSIEVPVSTTTHDGARSLDCGCLFMIPQAHSNAKIRIKYNTDKTAEIPLGTINWEAGKLYTISIRLGTNTIVTE